MTYNKSTFENNEESTVLVWSLAGSLNHFECCYLWLETPYFRYSVGKSGAESLVINRQTPKLS